MRAFRARLVRKGEDGQAEYDVCGHAHPKPGNAKKCAEAEAKRRNRRLAKEKT